MGCLKAPPSGWGFQEERRPGGLGGCLPAGDSRGDSPQREQEEHAGADAVGPLPGRGALPPPAPSPPWGLRCGAPTLHTEGLTRRPASAGPWRGAAGALAGITVEGRPAGWARGAPSGRKPGGAPVPGRPAKGSSGRTPPPAAPSRGPSAVRARPCGRSRWRCRCRTPRAVGAGPT